MIQRLDSTNGVTQPPLLQRRLLPTTKSIVPKSFHHQNRLFKERKQYVSCVPREPPKPQQLMLGFGHMQLVNIHLQDMPSPKKINIPRNWLQFYLVTHIHCSLEEDTGVAQKSFGGGYQVSQTRPTSKKLQSSGVREVMETSPKQLYGLQDSCPAVLSESPISMDKMRSPAPLLPRKIHLVEVENSFEDKSRFMSLRDRSLVNLNSGQKVQKRESGINVRKIQIEKSMLKLISAKSFVILDQQTKAIVYSRKSRKEREIASLTKIMTCFVACDRIRNHGLAPETIVPISKRMASLTGTTANLKHGDELTLMDLLYGTMLPSGNDASAGVADAVGRHLLKGKTAVTSSQALQAFLEEMNKKGQEMDLQFTNFANPHGLANSENYSSAFDQSMLIVESMKNDLFATIVKSLSYRCQVQNNRSNSMRDMVWENTNKLLSRRDCVGVKTGVTPSAGSCLAANFQTPTLQLIIVLLKASGVEERFTEMIHIYEYTKRKLSSV